MRPTMLAWRPAILTIATLLMLVPTARGQGPCCSITGIDANSGVVSAKVSGTGATFQFKVNDFVTFKALRMGQGVYANFPAKQVSLNGKSIAGPIVAIAATREGPSRSSPSAGASSGSAPATNSGNTNQPAGSSTSSPSSGTPAPSMTSAARLAAIPIPSAFLPGGALICKSPAYAVNNDFLDVLVGGCVVPYGAGVPGTIVSASQPDISDPAATPAGAGGPYKLSSTNQLVTICRDKNNAAVDLSSCLEAAAYSGSALANAVHNQQVYQQLLQSLQ
jgi:hypothetical protein